MHEELHEQICPDVPEAPYSDKWPERIHHTVDVLHIVHMVAEIYGPELTALLGVSVEVLSPILGILAGASAPFLAIGAGYWQGRREESEIQVRRGYALGVVTGIGGESWSLVKERFLVRTAPINNFDQGRADVGMKAYNLGLAAGFLCGQKLTQNMKKVKFFWDSIGSVVSAASKAEYARTLQRYGPHSQDWPKNEWFYFYFAAAGAFTKLYLKE